MIEKQLAGIVDEQEKGHIIVDPWIPQALEMKRGLFGSILSGRCCRRRLQREKVKIDQQEQIYEHDADIWTEASVKRIDYMRELNMMILHSYRRTEIYALPTEYCKKTRKIQEIEFEEDINVGRCFAFNTFQLLFANNKQARGFLWNEQIQAFEEQERLIHRDQIMQVCGNVEDMKDPHVKNGFILRNSRNQLSLVRFLNDKVTVVQQSVVEDRGILFEKERNFIFYHQYRVILIRWQADYESENGNKSKKEGSQSSLKKSSASYSFSKKTLSLKAPVILTVFECNPKQDKFFVKQYSHKLDLKEFEVIAEIDEAYILPQMQNSRNRIAIVCQNKTFLLVFGYKDGSYYLDKAAHNKMKLNFDITNNIIVGVKENSICEISTFNDSGSYEALLQNSTQVFFQQSQTCIDVQENFLLPFDGDSVVAVEQIKLEKGFEYYFIVQEPTELDEEDDGSEEEQDERVVEEKERLLDGSEISGKGQSSKVRQRKTPACNSQHDHNHSDESNDECCNTTQATRDSSRDETHKKVHSPVLTVKKQKLTEKIIFSIYKMKLVTPKEKLRYLISENMDIKSAINWFGFNTEIVNMISWEHSKKTYVEVETYLIDSRPQRDNEELQGVRDYDYLKKELKWLIRERNLKVGQISRILLHMIETFARNQFTSTFSGVEKHQKYEDLEQRLRKIAQILFCYQKLIVSYQPDQFLEKGEEEFNQIWKHMTLQELFLLVLEKKSEGSLIEFVGIFKAELLNNYFSLFYLIRRQLRDKSMKTLFMKIEFLLPVLQERLEERRANYEMECLPLNIPELELWDTNAIQYGQTLFCAQYARNCATFSEQEQVENVIIPNFVKNREKFAHKFLFSTVEGVENLQKIKNHLQEEKTYLKLANQFTQLYGESDFALQLLHAAIKDKGYKNSKVLRKEYITLSLYSMLLYESNIIDIDYSEFRPLKTLQKFSQIISFNPTNPSIILCNNTIQLFQDYSLKPNKFLNILQKFIHLQECTPRIFHEIFKCIQKVSVLGNSIQHILFNYEFTQVRFLIFYQGLIHINIQSYMKQLIFK